MRATDACLEQAGLSLSDVDIVACLALAGASEPSSLAAARAYNLPFSHTLITTDAHAACIGSMASVTSASAAKSSSGSMAIRSRRSACGSRPRT